MRWETVALLVFGFLCGMTVMYILNRRQRIQEFNKIAEITEDILNERKVQAFSTGEETLYSKLEHQLVRVQEMLQGRSRVLLSCGRPERRTTARSLESISKLNSIFKSLSTAFPI